VSDTPKKAIRAGCPSISNAAPRAAVRIDHQFSARAEGSPFLRSLGWFSPVPVAEFLSELPDTLDAIFRDENRDLAQPLRSWGSGWRPALVHQRVPGRYPAPVRAIQQTGKAGESGAMVSERERQRTRESYGLQRLTHPYRAHQAGSRQFPRPYRGGQPQHHKRV